jgi:hypothetical protein
MDVHPIHHPAEFESLALLNIRIRKAHRCANVSRRSEMSAATQSPGCMGPETMGCFPAKECFQKASKVLRHGKFETLQQPGINKGDFQTMCLTHGSHVSCQPGLIPTRLASGLSDIIFPSDRIHIRI